MLAPLAERVRAASYLRPGRHLRHRRSHALTKINGKRVGSSMLAPLQTASLKSKEQNGGRFQFQKAVRRCRVRLACSELSSGSLSGDQTHWFPRTQRRSISIEVQPDGRTTGCLFHLLGSPASGSRPVNPNSRPVRNPPIFAKKGPACGCSGKRSARYSRVCRKRPTQNWP